MHATIAKIWHNKKGFQKTFKKQMEQCAPKDRPAKKVLPKRSARNENKRPAERCRRTGANVKPKCRKSEDKTGDDESRDLD